MLETHCPSYLDLEDEMTLNDSETKWTLQHTSLNVPYLSFFWHYSNKTNYDVQLKYNIKRQYRINIFGRYDLFIWLKNNKRPTMLYAQVFFLKPWQLFTLIFGGGAFFSIFISFLSCMYIVYKVNTSGSIISLCSLPSASQFISGRRCLFLFVFYLYITIQIQSIFLFLYNYYWCCFSSTCITQSSIPSKFPIN